MTALRAALLLILAAWVQAALPPVGGGGGVAIPVLLGLALHYALIADARTSQVVSVAAALIFDALGFLPLGISVIGFLLVAEFWRGVRDLLFVNHAVTHVLLGAASAAMVEGITGLLLHVGGYRTVPPGLWAVRVTSAALTGALASPVVLGVLGRVRRPARPGWRAA